MPGQAAPRPDIIEVAGRRLDLDHDIVGTGLGLRDVLILQDFIAAVALEHYRFHRYFFFSGAGYGQPERLKLNSKKLSGGRSFDNYLYAKPPIIFMQVS